jgi:hypothetical protein
MNTRLEIRKKRLALALLIPNTILGLFALFFWNYVVTLILPLFGYGLLWAYWLEWRSTNPRSQMCWASSIMLNLLGVIIWGNLLNDTVKNSPGGLGDDFNPIMLSMLWTVLMSAASLWGLVMVLRIQRQDSAQLE